ncbi:MAG: 6-pyruvoyl-tetrahydropterin synthase-related protein, partial [Anaerolineae bacterium]
MLRRITRDPGVSPGSLRDVARELLSAADRVDLGLILALVLALLAALPFLTRASLPHQTDAELHVYRTAELGRIVRQGILYPRWASNFYLGYGYPIFNYYAPCTYHLGTWLAAIIPGAGVVAGTKMVFVFGLMLASVGAYLLGRDIFEPAGGVLAAASFTLSPYVLFIDPHARGDLAEHFAICLLPLTFYFVRRLMTTPKPGPLAGTVLTLAVLVFSHNLLGLVASFLLLFYWVWRLLLGPRQSQLLWVLLAFSLAGGLIAFFWVPALVERGAVRLDVIGPGHFDFREHFLTVRDLLAPSRRLDWGATGPRYRHNLGIVQWVLAVPAGAVLLRSVLKGRDGEASWDVGYFVAGAVGLIFLMISPSTVVWETIPAMAYLQFPWRLLGSANFMLAVCVAGAVALLPDRPWRRMVLAGGLVTLLAGALPLLYPPPWPADFGPTTAPAVLQWE